MHTKHWFHKKHGRVTTPVTWEGWFTSISFVILILLSAYTNGLFAESLSMFTGGRFLYDLIVLSFLFMLVFEKKTLDEQTEKHKKWKVWKK